MNVREENHYEMSQSNCQIHVRHSSWCDITVDINIKEQILLIVTFLLNDTKSIVSVTKLTLKTGERGTDIKRL